MCKPVAGFVTANLKGRVKLYEYLIWRNLCSLFTRFYQLFRNVWCKRSVVGAVRHRRLCIAITEKAHICCGEGGAHSLPDGYVHGGAVEFPDSHPHHVLQPNPNQTERATESRPGGRTVLGNDTHYSLYVKLYVALGMRAPMVQHTFRKRYSKKLTTSER